MAGGLEHPDLSGVAGEMRAVWRAEQEDAAADAAAVWRHSRTLVDWLAERMHAGDRVAVTVTGRRFTGLVEEAGPDLIGLRCAFGRVDVHVVAGSTLVIEIDEKARSGGGRGATDRTFHGALAARDAQRDVTVGTLHDDQGLDGTLYVGRDFVSIVAVAGAETVVPYENVTYVMARRA
jgi:hypothetical protein